MKLIEINHYKDLFAKHLITSLSQNAPYQEAYKWDIIGNWQREFSLEELDISSAYAKSLKNDYSGRLWDGERFSVKSEMLNLIEINPLLMRIAFQDLFDESKDINMRYSRFHFHCDQALQELKQKDDRYVDHKQSDHAISLYLSLHYPETYGLYDYPKFYKFMDMIGSRNIPLEQEKDRYFKSFNAIYTVISKDDEFMNGFKFLTNSRAYTGKSLMLINDLIDFTLESSK